MRDIDEDMQSTCESLTSSTALWAGEFRRTALRRRYHSLHRGAVAVVGALVVMIGIRYPRAVQQQLGIFQVAVTLLPLGLLGSG